MLTDKKLSISCFLLITIVTAIFIWSFVMSLSDTQAADTNAADTTNITSDTSDSMISDTISDATEGTDSMSTDTASDATEGTGSMSTDTASDGIIIDASNTNSDSTDVSHNTSETTNTAASDTNTMVPLHVYFNFYDSSSGDINRTIGLHSKEVMGTVTKEYIEAAINEWPGMFDFQEVDGFPQVLINYGDVSGREINISEECHYDPETGLIQIPVNYQNDYLTVKCIMSDQSTAYQMLVPDEYKVTKTTNLPMMRAPATDTSQFEVLEGSSNDITLVGDTSPYNVGDVITVTEGFIQTLNKNEDASLYGLTGTSAYMGYKGEAIGYAISFHCNEDPLFSNIGNPGGAQTGKFPVSYGSYMSMEFSSRNWIYARCITTDSNYFDGNPKFSSGKIHITNKAEDGTLTCWVELYLTGPHNENAQDVGMYFKIHPLELQSLTIKKRELFTTKLLPGAKFSLWSFDGTAYNRRLGYFTDNQNGTYTFDNINVNASYEQRFLIKEEAAPAGYALPYYQANTNDQADYSAYGGRTVQYVDGAWTSTIPNFDTFFDKPRTKANLTINKTIYREDVYWSHGEPTFFFKIHGFDMDGNSHTWHRCISFNARYVNENTATDGTITLSATLTDIPRGTYTIAELPVSRFALTNVTAQTDNIYISLTSKTKTYEGIIPVSAVVRADLTDSDGEVTFFNRKITWEKYNHNDVILNEFTLGMT